MQLKEVISPEINEFISLFLFRKYDIPDVKLSISQPRTMSKLITRLIKQYELSQDISPHLNIKRSEGALQFLIHKRYIDGSLSKHLFFLSYLYLKIIAQRLKSLL